MIQAATNGGETDDLLTIRQAALLLNVHPNTLRNWEIAGKIRTLRIGSRQDRRYHRKPLLKLLKILPPHPLPKPNALNPTKLISLTEAAQHCRYSSEYLSLMARRGLISAFKLGRNWVTTPDAVIEYEKQMRKKIAARRPPLSRRA